MSNKRPYSIVTLLNRQLSILRQHQGSVQCTSRAKTVSPFKCLGGVLFNTIRRRNGLVALFVTFTSSFYDQTSRITRGQFLFCCLNMVFRIN